MVTRHGALVLVQTDLGTNFTSSLFEEADQKDWECYLDLVLLAYRTSTHSSTDVSPFHMPSGRETTLHFHLIAQG